MTFLLDANVLIRASLDYYPFDVVPQFWEWLLDKGAEGVVKIPRAIHGEITGKTDALCDWAMAPTFAPLLLEEEPDNILFNRVLAQYAPDLDESEILTTGCDPFLIAHALAVAGRIVVTKENSKPNAQRANRKIPDVCADLGVPCIRDFEFFRRAGFRAR